jgi:thioredoxin reductase
MPTSSSAVPVGTTATQLHKSEANRELVYLQDGDYDGQSLVYVGGSDVTVDTGIKLSKINVTVFSLYEFDELHAISDSASGEVRVIVVN